MGIGHHTGDIVGGICCCTACSKATCSNIERIGTTVDSGNGCTVVTCRAQKLNIAWFVAHW